MSATERAQRRTIEGKGKTIREILFSRKFYIDYYQREYKLGGEAARGADRATWPSLPPQLRA